MKAGEAAKPVRQERNSRFSNLWLQLVSSVIALALFAVVVLFVQATPSAQWRSDRGMALGDLDKKDVSATLGVLRLAQGVLAAITASALTEAFVFLQWKLMNSPDGMSYHSLLGLSPTTGNLGTIALLIAAAPRLPSKLWALMRVALTLILWISGLVLFFDTSLVTVFDTIDTYNVTAGVGTFNSSLVEPFFRFLSSLAPQYEKSILPYTYYAAAYTLVLNPLISTISEPVTCLPGLGLGCVSYLLSGGLEMVAPWAPQTNLFRDYPMVKIDRIPAVQLDFQGPVQDSHFIDTECDIFGEPGVAIGIRFCLSEVPSLPGSLRAGLFACNGTDGGTCGQTGLTAPNITTIVSFYARRATVVAARGNYSIVSVADTTAPILFTDIHLPSYRHALSWLLNYTAAGVPAPSSIAQSFWSSKTQLGDPAAHGILSQNFQSLLAFPFWLFNANNWGNTALRENTTIPTLPPQFYTQASIVAPYTKIRFNQAMFALFIAFQGLAMAFVWVVLVVVWRAGEALPTTSSYPIFDVAFKAKVDAEAKARGVVVNANSLTIVNLMKDAKAVLKDD